MKKKACIASEKIFDVSTYIQKALFLQKIRTLLIRLPLHARKSIMVKHAQNDDAITPKYLTFSDILVPSVGKED